MNRRRTPRWALALLLGGSIACSPPGNTPTDMANTLDRDRDGVTAAQGDCDDDDPSVHPGANELCDGRDHNCNGIADDICDDDGDGYAVLAGGNVPGGDCDDHEPLIGPDAVEAPGNRVDDDCNGLIDEAQAPCPVVLPPTDAVALATAVGVCGRFLRGASLSDGSGGRGYAVRAGYGVIRPRQGAHLLVLSTGIAADEADPGFVPPQPGTALGTTAVNPLPGTNTSPTCGTSAPAPPSVSDLIELRVTLKTPANARSLRFQFSFLSSEYPEFVGSEHNDKFLALLESSRYSGNISFDAQGNAITINGGFFAACEPTLVCGGTRQSSCPRPLSEIDGTGYEQVFGDGLVVGGGTGWLTTTAPVTPGELITLRFLIFDEGDGLYDSAVLLDAFQWQLEAAAAPYTVP